MAAPTLGEAFLDDLDASLAETDALLTHAYPGDDGRRQPVHTVYVPADLYTTDLPRRWGEQALALVDERGGLAALAADLRLDDALAAQVCDRVAAKLRTAPIEDLRLDFEDGYGDRGDDTEDADAVAAGNAVADALEAGTSPDFIGIRFKCFEEPTRRRGIRTLDLFLGALLARTGQVPPQLVLTFPKVSTVGQVEAMVAVCEALEKSHGLAAGDLGFEIQVETPQLILGPDGSAPLARAVHAGQGRVTSLHYGTYDYSASLGISAEFQASDHPAADHAKQVMQLAVAGTGVHLSDGSTNVVPTGSAAAVRAAWSLHAGLVTRALGNGFYQGWDLHPGQLPTRYLATFAFYRAGYERAATRLANYVSRSGSGIMDEPATARALARYLQRGHACGAVEGAELHTDTGLSPEAVAALARPRSDTEGIRRPLPSTPTPDSAPHGPNARTAVAVGDLAPELELTTHRGERFSLTALRGTPVVVYFFPKAFTPGCTTEVCSFRDNQVPLARAGYQLVGVSGDSVPVLREFAEANAVEHDLLSDPEHTSAIRWGAYGPKVVAGKDMVGPLRSTFVVGADGRVTSVEHDLDAVTHVSTLRRELGA